MGNEEPPQHEAVANALRGRLDNGEWGVGERLPSRARLAEYYEVGPNVMQKAVERLIAEGRLQGRAGSGPFVADPRERRRMIRSRHRERRRGSPFRADMAELGRSGTWEAHSEARTPAPHDIAQRLG